MKPTQNGSQTKLSTFIKFCCIICLVIFLPRIISRNKDIGDEEAIKNYRILLGIENLVTTQQAFKHIKALKLAIICNHTSVDQHNNRSIDILLKHGFDVQKIFFVSDVSTHITWATDNKTKRPVISVTQDTLAQIPRKTIKSIDAIIVDLQDEGTMASTPTLLLPNLFKLAQKHNKQIIILDRPNPLGGAIEGPGAIPLRHGMTIAELAQYHNKYIIEKPIQLHIVPLAHWRRNQTNLPELMKLQTRSVLELLSNIKPIHLLPDDSHIFHLVLFPEKERLSPWETRYFKKICRQLGLYCRDYDRYDEKLKTRLFGVKTHIKTDIEKFSAFNSFLALLRFLNNRKHISLSFPQSFDEQIGDPDVRKYLQGYIRFDDLKQKIGRSNTMFYNQARHCFLYKPHPKIINPELIKV